jgi:hypothetical protein
MNETKITRSLFIQAREWYDKTYGNSYFSATITVDGNEIAVLPFQYGYGNHYENVAGHKLVELGYITGEQDKGSLYSLARNNGFDFYSSKKETLKRNMFTQNKFYQEVSA